MDNQSQYWFYIDSFIHVSIKNRDVLLYNLYSGKINEFPGTIYGHAISKITRRLLSPRNLRVIKLSAMELANPAIAHFVRVTRDSYMGDLIPVEFSDSKPIQITYNRAKIQTDLYTVFKDPDSSPGQYLMGNLTDITLYINDTCERECVSCSGFYKQAGWCQGGKSGKRFLDISLLQHFFHEIKGCNLNYIHITGGNILLYPNWSELTQLLDTLDTPIRFYLNTQQMETNLTPLHQLNREKHQIRLLFHSPYHIESFKNAYTTLCLMGFQVIPVFFIQNDEEYTTIEDLLTQFPVECPVFLPYYNQHNLDFFQSNFFITREDLEAKKPTQRTIHANGCMNLDNFGRITILANGKVHANVLSPALGTLGKDSIYDCLFKELKTGRSWFKLRKHSLPCKQCTFNLLCPPISNYNRVMRRHNLCHIHQTN